MKKKKLTSEIIIFLDGNAIVHRAFHALPPLTAPDGRPTNAVYGFVTILLKIINDLQPDYILATFDLAGPTFRHKAFEGYKAQRIKGPDELYAQFPLVKEILSLLGIPIYEKEGYEADDIIGTGVKFFEKHSPKDKIIIVTGDLDTLQLVSKKTSVFTMRKGLSDTIFYDEKAVHDRYGFSLEHVIDYKGLRGDPSDNIPGVRGIGEKTATDLIQKFGSIENIYKNLAKIKPDGVRKKLEESKEEAFFSKELATINVRVPVQIKKETARFNADLKDNEKLRELFLELGFRSLVQRLQMGGVPKKQSDGSPLLIPIQEKKSSKNWQRVAQEEFRMLAEKIESAGAVSLGFFGDEGILQGLEAGKVMYGALPNGELFSVSENTATDPLLKKIYENEKIAKVMFDGRVIASFLRDKNIFLKGQRFDVVLAEYVVSPHEKDYTSSSIVLRELKKKSARPEEAVSLGFELEKRLMKKLSESKLSSILTTIEIALIPFLTEMEYWGIALDQKRLSAISKDVSARLEKLTSTIYSLAGQEFNISSSQQVSKILFEKLQLLEKGLRKTKGGVQSTQASELQKLQEKHPIVRPILEYRELQKLKTTYVDVLPTLLSSRDQRIHTTFNQTGTVTGRLSSSNPNLQNIPTRTELGREIRKAFVPAKGFEFLAFDYSQIELRIAAHLSNDKKMREAFQKGIDIHTMTAAEVNNLPIEEVTKELRREAKTLNFGVLYGMGSRAFAESSGIPKEKAKAFIERYFEDFSGIRSYLDATKERAYKTGYVETMLGRRRYMPELQSPYIQVRLEGERMAINMPIQGTAADMMKLAMVHIYKEIISKHETDEIRPLLQIHDELVFEVKEGVRKKYESAIKAIMENILPLSVPVIVDVKAGRNLGELENSF